MALVKFWMARSNCPYECKHAHYQGSFGLRRCSVPFHSYFFDIVIVLLCTSSWLRVELLWRRADHTCDQKSPFLGFSFSPSLLYSFRLIAIKSTVIQINGWFWGTIILEEKMKKKKARESARKGYRQATYPSALRMAKLVDEVPRHSIGIRVASMAERLG